MTTAETRAARIAELAGLAGCVNALLLVMHMLVGDRQAEALETAASMADDVVRGLDALARTAP